MQDTLTSRLGRVIYRYRGSLAEYHGRLFRLVRGTSRYDATSGEMRATYENIGRPGLVLRNARDSSMAITQYEVGEVSDFA